MQCKKRPLKVIRNPTVLQKVHFNVVKGHVTSIELAVESASGVEVPAHRDLLTWLVAYAIFMHRRFWVGRDGKTAYQRGVGRCAVFTLGTVR